MTVLLIAADTRRLKFWVLLPPVRVASSLQKTLSVRKVWGHSQFLLNTKMYILEIFTKRINLSWHFAAWATQFRAFSCLHPPFDIKGNPRSVKPAQYLNDVWCLQNLAVFPLTSSRHSVSNDIDLTEQNASNWPDFLCPVLQNTALMSSQPRLPCPDILPRIIGT